MALLITLKLMEKLVKVHPVDKKDSCHLEKMKVGLYCL